MLYYLSLLIVLGLVDIFEIFSDQGHVKAFIYRCCCAKGFWRVNFLNHFLSHFSNAFSEADIDFEKNSFAQQFLHTYKSFHMALIWIYFQNIDLP